MKKTILPLCIAVSLSGCNSGGTTTKIEPIDPQNAAPKIVIIPLAYADADPSTIDDGGELISVTHADQISRLFLDQLSPVNQWFEWASKGKHRFNKSSNSLEWKATSLRVPGDACGNGDGRFYPLQKILPQLHFTADEMAEINSADQIVVLGYGQGNCRSNDSFKNTSAVAIGGGKFNHVVYVDLEREPFTRTVLSYIGPDYVGMLDYINNVRLYPAQQTFIHEYLHTFNIGHADAAKHCSWQMINDGLCSLEAVFNEPIIVGGDYADAYDIMGSRNLAYGLNAIYRMKLGWLEPADELIVDGPAKILSSINEDNIPGSKILKVRHKNKVLYFSNNYQQLGTLGFDDILQADFELFTRSEGRYSHHAPIMAQNTDGVMLHYEKYNSTYDFWSTRLISRSGYPNEFGDLRYEKAAFTEGTYHLDNQLVLTVTKLADGKFELQASSS